MKKVLSNDKLGEIVFEESAWTGRKNLTINGKKLTKIDKTSFKTEDDKTIVLTGNYLLGCKMKYEEEIIELTPPIKWYEYLLSILPFILIMIWGNITELCLIVPIVGGAVGGLVSALFCIANLLIIKKVKQWWFKVLISVVTLGLTFLVCYLIALAILSIA